MNRFLLPVMVCVVAFACVACSDAITSNTPVIQGSVDNEFFRAPDASAVLNEDGSVKLTGINESRTITLQTSSPSVGQYPLGNSPINVATFLDFDQTLYVAGPDSGEGLIEITEVEEGKLSGVFYFNAFSPGGEEVLNFQKGVFFEVPIKNLTGDVPEGDDTLSADIDGTSFVADIVNVQNNMGSLMVSGIKQTSSISLSFEANIAVGDHDLTEIGGPVALYTVNNTVEEAISGILTIVSNDTETKEIEGTFEFTTDVSGTVIDNGSFFITYE